MYAYRYVPYLSPTDDLPVLPFVSFAEAFDLTRISAIPMDWIETTWDFRRFLALVLHYYESDIYYFLLPSDVDCPNTAECRRVTLESLYDTRDHHCDYYAKPILLRFIQRFNARRHTRMILTSIQQRIPFDRDTPVYHEALLHELQRVKIDDSHDDRLFISLLRETEDAVNTERRYRPGGEGMEEAREEFEILTILMK